MIRARKGPKSTTNKVRSSQAREPLAHRLSQEPFCWELALEQVVEDESRRLEKLQLLAGDAPPQLPVGLRLLVYCVLPPLLVWLRLLVDGVLPQLLVGLRLLVGDALPPLLVWLRLLVGDALPQLPVGLRLLVGDVLPQLPVGLRLLVDGVLPPLLVWLRLLVGDALPQLPVGLRPLGVLAAITMVAAMLCRCSRKAFPPVVQPRSTMDRGVASSAIARIGDCR